jgi:hypothetical protein
VCVTIRKELTVAARLYRSLDVTNALDGDTVLVVAIDVLVFEFTNLVNQHTELVGDVRYVVVASLTPDGKLLLWDQSACVGGRSAGSQAYGNFHAFTGHQLHAAHHVLLHLYQLGQFLCEIGAESTCRLVTKGMAYEEVTC